MGIDEGLLDGVRLATQEKGRLALDQGKDECGSRRFTRARILIKIDEGWTAPQVANDWTCRSGPCSAPSGGMPSTEVLRHHNQVNRPRKVDERLEAHLIALACSPVARRS